jgi:hypothetical protein
MDEEERDRTAKTVQKPKIKIFGITENFFGKEKNSLHVDFSTCGNKMTKDEMERSSRARSFKGEFRERRVYFQRREKYLRGQFLD